MTDDRATPWDARHIFYAQPAHADQLILAMRDVMAELAPGSTDWFYIRYVEGGAHVRWRIHDRLSDIRERAFASIAALNADLCAQDGVGQAVVNAAFPDEQGIVHTPGTSVAIAYEREWDRYGGPAAIAIHEELFGVSTQIAAEIIKATAGDQQTRAKRAIPLMIGTAAAMVGSFMPPRSFFEQYSRFWRAYWTPRTAYSEPDSSGAAGVAGLSTLIDHQGAIAAGRIMPTNGADQWTAANGRAAAALRTVHARGQIHNANGSGPCSSDAQLEQALAQFCHSQIHMMNNRLGLAPSAEIRLSDIISASL